MRRRRRRRSSGRRGGFRRRYRRNPSFGLKGLDLQTAVLAVAGAAVAKMLVARFVPSADGKVRAAATLGAGLAFNMIPVGSASLRNKLSLGAQIAGVSALLSEFMPGVFAGVESVSDVAMLSGVDDGIPGDDTDEYLLGGMDATEPELVSTI